MKDRLMEKLEKIEGLVNNTRIDTGKIQQHLQDLNGTILKHYEMIKCNENEIHETKLQQVKLAGMVGVIVAFLTVLLNWIFSNITL